MTPIADSDLVLIDTNVLVYALDPVDHAKQRVAIDVLDALAAQGRGSVSVQCLNELFNAITRKIAQPIPADRAADHVADAAATFVVHDLTSEMVLLACRTVAVSQMSLWDALIWSAARQNHITTILTEDMQHRTSIDGIQYFNPFAETFSLTSIRPVDRSG